MITARELAIIPTLMLACISTAGADIVKFPGQTPSVLQAADQPGRGLTMEQVRSRFGEPVSQRGPVGDPPISSWDYGPYTVYFEGDHVLHSVVSSR